MQRFFISAVVALGFVALWAVMPQPATRPVSSITSPAMSKALFLCHNQQGVVQPCVTALVSALLMDQQHAVTPTTGKVCHVERQTRIS